MSTVKISELTALTSADAADELVIVDDSAGVTKKITHANLANFGTGTVTAGAIDFSGNANAAGMTSELLDDYEEGTWTPTVRGSTTAGTYTINQLIDATYTKVGRLVQVQAVLNGFSSATGGSGNLEVAGLPFVKPSASSLGGSARWINISGETNDVGMVGYSSFGSAQSHFIIWGRDPGVLDIADVQSTSILFFAFSYRTNT